MTCGIDLIQTIIKESLSGFEYFLRALDSRISAVDENGEYNKILKFNVYGVGYEASYSTSSSTIKIKVGALREYKHDTRSQKRWQFLQSLYRTYPNLRITELHFATDAPYWFGELKVSPKQYTKKYNKSTLYFDKRRARLHSNMSKLKSRDSIIIYDKSWKCGLILPLTRIEIRIEKRILDNIIKEACLIRDDSSQRRLQRYIIKALAPVKVKKGRYTIHLEQCNQYKAIATAMQYIQGDDSLLTELLKHRTDDISKGSKVFDKCVRIYCDSGHKSKTPLSSNAIQEYANTLNVRQKFELLQSFGRFKKYGLQTKCKRESTLSKRVRLTEEERDAIIEMSFQGMLMTEIADLIGVSESTVSRAMKRRGIKRVRLKASIFNLL